MAKSKKQELSERSLENYLYASDKARMYTLVADMMTRAMNSLDAVVVALDERDIAEADKVIADDDVIDDLEEEIDQECLYSIAMRQPLREDLRYVYAVMKIITDIERIGDQAVNLALCLKNYVVEGGITTPMPKIDEMKEAVVYADKMGREFLEGLKNEDAGTLERIRAQHVAICAVCDAANEKLMRRLTSAYSNETPPEIFCAADIFRHLKRVGDHMMNLAEKIYFIATGISPMTLKRQMLDADGKPVETPYHNG